MKKYDGSTTGSKYLDNIASHAKDRIIQAKLQKPEGLGSRGAEIEEDEPNPKFTLNHRGEWVVKNQISSTQTNTGESFADIFARINEKN